LSLLFEFLLDFFSILAQLFKKKKDDVNFKKELVTMRLIIAVLFSCFPCFLFGMEKKVEKPKTGSSMDKSEPFYYMTVRDLDRENHRGLAKIVFKCLGYCCKKRKKETKQYKQI
jgi:hypothetical protein